MTGHTKGPWSWFGNAKNNEVYLATVHSGRRYVMGFQRWGMRGAQPTFQPAERGLVPSEKLFTFEVGDSSIRGVEAAKADDSVYRLDINGIDCADARLIASAPALFDALEDMFNSACTNATSTPSKAAFLKARAAIALAKGAGV